MTARRLSLLAALLGSVLAGTLLGSQAGREQAGFPHAEHARLFPLCIGCHEGVPSGDRAEFYPDPSLCAQCHDGERQPRVEWAGPRPLLTNLDFSHPQHDRAAGEVVRCETCHTPEGGPRMQVTLAEADRCFACHEAHPAQDHLVDATCTNCHLPLAETRFTLNRVQDLPEPQTHQDPLFLAEVHGTLAAQDPTRCATCHTRELCTACHVDVPAVPTIAQLPPRGAALELPAFTASYPVPASHLDPLWEVRHGRAMTSPAECSTCHTRNGCETCHSEPGTRTAGIVAQLPASAAVEAPGVVLARRAPESHASPWFAMRHGEVAATRRETCSSCHAQQTFCTTCHLPVAASALPAGTAGERRPETAATARLAGRGAPAPALARAATAADSVRLRAAAAARIHVPHEARAQRAPAPRAARRATEFHPAGFSTNHAAAAYGRRLDCAQCHEQRTFCRDCHTEAGFQARGRLGQGYHDAEPVWLLRHGQAARQTLESCTTCHAQRDCLQCHSQLGAFRVNPHRSDFDARRAQRRNPAICFACHANDPVERRTP